MPYARIAAAAALAALMISGTAAHAQSAGSSQAPAPAPANIAPAPPSDESFGGATLEASELGALSGGQSVTVTTTARQVLTATNSGNRVSGNTVGSGAISINENAFSGFNGVGNFVMNTGHNNNLQGSLNVTVITLPAATPGS